MPKLLVSVGETSADMHTGALLKELRALDPSIETYGVGGEECATAGMRLIAHQRDLSVYGVFELIFDLPRVLAIFFRMFLSVRREHPDAVLLVDLPDFNIWLARLIRLFYRRRIPIIYYISPQIWLWRTGRVQTLKRLVTKMLVIFPFEEKLYRDAGAAVEFVGHPLVDRVPPDLTREKAREALGIPVSAQVIALLPGSRAGEVRSHLPYLLKATERVASQRAAAGLSPLVVLLPRAPSLAPELLQELLRSSSLPVRVCEGQVYEILAAADVALIKFGTAVLECGLIGTPEIAVGRITWLSYFIGWHVLRIRPPHFTLTNIVLGRSSIPEHIQGKMETSPLAAGITAMLDNAQARSEAETRSRQLRDCLRPGDTPASTLTAAARAARAVLAALQ